MGRYGRFQDTFPVNKESESVTISNLFSSEREGGGSGSISDGLESNAAYKTCFDCALKKPSETPKHIILLSLGPLPVMTISSKKKTHTYLMTYLLHQFSDN